MAGKTTQARLSGDTPGETKSLRDLVIDAAADRCIAPARLWESALLAIADNVLHAGLPNGATLDTRHDAGTWRDVIAGAARAAARGDDPASYFWTRSIFLSPREFRDWLDQVYGTLDPEKPFKREEISPRRASRRAAALQALEALYPGGRPLGSIKTITVTVNEWLADRSGGRVSEDTVSRALKAFEPKQA